VSAIPARPPRSTRLARTLGLDVNPLRRATDRAMTWIRVGLLAAFLTGGPLAAIGAGHWMYHAGMTEARAQAADRRTRQHWRAEPAGQQRHDPSGTDADAFCADPSRARPR
jgi:hypothetical protein